MTTPQGMLELADANLKDADEFCTGAFGPFVTDVSQYTKIVAELMQHATDRALASRQAAAPQGREGLEAWKKWAALTPAVAPDAGAALLTEQERHAVGHARYQVDNATPDDPECCFDYELVATLIGVVDRLAALAQAQEPGEDKQTFTVRGKQVELSTTIDADLARYLCEDLAGEPFDEVSKRAYTDEAEAILAFLAAHPPPQVDSGRGPTAEDIYACAKSTLIGFRDELSEDQIKFICDQISRKATMRDDPVERSGGRGA